MENLKEHTTEDLLQILARYNDEYALLMLRGTKEEFDECKNSIISLQEELNSRKESESNSLT